MKHPKTAKEVLKGILNFDILFKRYCPSYYGLKDFRSIRTSCDGHNDCTECWLKTIKDLK